MKGAYIEYDGVRHNLDHLAEPVQAGMVREALLYADAGIRPPTLAVIAAGVQRCLKTSYRVLGLTAP